MISWHKVGQKVAVIGEGWTCPFTGQARSRGYGPNPQGIYTIAAVEIRRDGKLRFELFEFPFHWWGAHRFRPVYPTIIDQLRKLDAPSPKRVKEDA